MFFLVIIQFKEELVNKNSVICTTEKFRQHDHINLFQFYDLWPIKLNWRRLNKFQVPHKVKSTTFCFTTPQPNSAPKLILVPPLSPKDTLVQDQAPCLEGWIRERTPEGWVICWPFPVTPRELVRRTQPPGWTTLGISLTGSNRKSLTQVPVWLKY